MHYITVVISCYIIWAYVYTRAHMHACGINVCVSKPIIIYTSNIADGLKTSSENLQVPGMLQIKFH